MGKSKKQQRQKAFQIFEGNAAAQEALKQAFQIKGKSGDKITNKEIGAIAAAGATQEQLNQLVDRVERSSGRLRIGTVDVGSYFPGSQAASGGGDDTTGDDDDAFEFPDYGAEIRDALADADDRYTELLDQMQIDQEAAEERQRQAKLVDARRMRAAGRAPNLQIKGAGTTPQTAGTQGFRRRKDQFRITPFKGISNIMNTGAQIGRPGPANQLVNI